MRPHVFISHSTESEADWAALETMAQGLDDAGYQVLLDRETLPPGSDWRPEIHTWMGVCHAAVILFSERAVASTWVQKEATILTWRKAIDPRFVLIPVLIPPLKRQELRSGPFAPLAIGEIQFPAGPLPLQAVVDRLAALKAADLKTPLERWTRILSQPLLALEAVQPAMIDAAAEAVGQDLPWDPSISKSERLARRLLHADDDEIEAAVSTLYGVLDAKELARIVHVLSCIWVDPLATAKIPEISVRPGRDEVIALNAKESWTGEKYVQRASCGDLDWRVLEAGNSSGEDEVGRITRELYEDARGKLNRRPDMGVDEFFRWVESTAVHRWRLFAVIPGAASFDESVITALRERLKDFTLIFLTGDAEPSAAIKASRAVTLTPPLGPDREQDSRDWFDILRGYLVSPEG